MARSQIRRSGEKGAGLALTGLILGYVGIVAWVVLMVGAVALVGHVTHSIQNSFPSNLGN
jgi:hypothetical protein